MLEPIVIVLMRPSGIMLFPPVAIVPVMVFIPIAVPSPFRVMHSDPIRDDSRTTSHPDATRDARHNPPSHDDNRPHAPKPALPKGIPLSRHSPQMLAIS